MAEKDDFLCAGGVGGESPVAIPKCPKCGAEATYRTPDGTWWDGNAHYWRTEQTSAIAAHDSE